MESNFFEGGWGTPVLLNLVMTEKFIDVKVIDKFLSKEITKRKGIVVYLYFYTCDGKRGGVLLVYIFMTHKVNSNTRKMAPSSQKMVLSIFDC